MAAATPVTATTIEAFENDLDAVLDAAKGELTEKKNETKAARARVRQVTRRRRHKRFHEITKAVTAAAPRGLFYTLALAGFTAFGIALTFLVLGLAAAALTLFTVAAAAWGMGAALRR
ncbi:hypothetical protein OHB35_52965 [Streptomyces phaeochromogenes]|uniref:Uncharacterized protein n=1 Tax=Streptomyces phaeochromogenes TaxID=1923 RepID=A0ABZ1HRP4_STRPH|nr:hypothetical protein [Streptomyces phaeochromogenes]WSD21255.1 hypothetical protein OHB35_52965 [Streptomyces phaeochromogenes]